MAADTPVVLGPKGVGGSRPGSGAKKGQHRVHVKELKDAIEAHVGKSFAEIQAITFMKLFSDFQDDHNVPYFIEFNKQMGNRLIELPDQSITDEGGVAGLTDAQLALAIKIALASQNHTKTGESTEPN